MSPKKETIGECEIWLGDMREVLPQIIGIHACVTDPPYHLTSAKPAKPRKRQLKGFMGQAWDGGDIAFQDSTWKLVNDALLPGAHLAAFSGSRTYHHMATAIERSGFEVRDMLMWLYGSGFPKNHDLAKAIDKRGGGMARESRPTATSRQSVYGHELRASAEGRCRLRRS